MKPRINIDELRSRIEILEGVIYRADDEHRTLTPDERFDYSMRLTMARQELAAALKIKPVTFQIKDEDEDA